MKTPRAKTIELFTLYNPDGKQRYGYRILGSNGRNMGGHPVQGYENKTTMKASIQSLWPEYEFNWRKGAEGAAWYNRNGETRFILNDLTV